MKVAQLLPYDIDYHGGVREVVFHLSRELEARGHETTVFAPASGTRMRAGTPRFIAIETRPVARPANGSIARVMGLDHAAWSRLVGSVRDGSFDVVHLHEPALWLPLLFSRHEPIGPTYVGTFHAAGDPAEIGNVSDLVGAVVSNLVADLVRTGEIASLPQWRPLARSVESRRRGEGRAVSSMSRVIVLARPAISSLLGRLDASVAVSRTARDFAASYGVTPTGIIPNGVDVAAFGERAEELAQPETRPTVLFFSRLEERKGLDTLMDAMPLVASRVPDVRLVVGGNFAMIDDRAVRYQALAVERGIDVGFVPSPAEEAKIWLFRSSTMLCAPALGQESFGIVLAEALAAGLPIVASDLTSFRDVLDDGTLGLLTPPGDEDSLAAAIVRMLTDEALRRELSSAGRVKVHDYAWDVVADRTLGVYHDALAQMNGRSRPATGWRGADATGLERAARGGYDPQSCCRAAKAFGSSCLSGLGVVRCRRARPRRARVHAGKPLARGHEPRDDDRLGPRPIAVAIGEDSHAPHLQEAWGPPPYGSGRPGARAGAARALWTNSPLARSLARSGGCVLIRHPAMLPVMDQQAKASRYEIHIGGLLSERLLSAFPELHARGLGSVTVLVGDLPDQAALHGVLSRIESLGLELLEVRRGSSRLDASAEADGSTPGLPAEDLERSA